MQMGFYFDQTRCTGCYTCTVACKDWHDIPGGPASWRRVFTYERGKYPEVWVDFLSISCNHCVKPVCAEVCPVEAIVKDGETGVIRVDPELCLGKEKCGLCLEACPWGVPQFRSEGDAKMEMCDFCVDRLRENKSPICVAACPMRALDAGPMAELKKKYGDIQECEGFAYSGELKPSLVVKPKPRTLR